MHLLFAIPLPLAPNCNVAEDRSFLLSRQQQQRQQLPYIHPASLLPGGAAYPPPDPPAHQPHLSQIATHRTPLPPPSNTQCTVAQRTLQNAADKYFDVIWSSLKNAALDPSEKATRRKYRRSSVRQGNERDLLLQSRRLLLLHF